MTHTEDDLRAALRLLEQRTPTQLTTVVDDPGYRLSAFASNDIVSARRSRLRWAAPVLAAAAVVAAVAGSTAIIANRGTASHPSAPQLQPVTSPTAATHSAPPAVTATPVALPGPLILNPTWLPAAGQQVTASIGYGEQYRGYNLHVDGFDLYVLLSLTNATALPTNKKGGAPVDITVAGYPAREWAADHYYTLAVQINPHQIATVNLQATNDTGGNGTAANLTAMGRHVATALCTDGNDALTPYYALTYLPPGTVVAYVDRYGTQEGSSYQLAPAHDSSTPRPTLASVTEVVGDPAKVHGPGQTTPGRQVQGHPTVVRHVNGGYGLTVLNFRPNISIDLYTGHGVSTLAELYRIADGLRWNG